MARFALGLETRLPLWIDLAAWLLFAWLLPRRIRCRLGWHEGHVIGGSYRCSHCPFSLPLGGDECAR